MMKRQLLLLFALSVCVAVLAISIKEQETLQKTQCFFQGRDNNVSVTIDETDTRLLECSKTEEYSWLEEFGIHTIDGISYRLVREYNNYHAYVVPLNETEHYAGDICVPDVVNYSNIPFVVFGVDGGFDDCPELTSLSIGVRSGVTNCPKLKCLEIRQNTLSFGGIHKCNALESVTFPSSFKQLADFSQCKNVKEIRFESIRKLDLDGLYDYSWSAESMPALTDVYFNSDYPPTTYWNTEIAPNPRVTIHVPSGTKPLYKESVFKNWKISDDLPAIPALVAWDYCGNDDDAGEGIVVGAGNNNVELAMCVPASHLTAYKGCKVTKIEFYTWHPFIDDSEMSDVEYVFLTKSGTDYLVKVPLTTVRGIWNTVELPEPYVITGDQLFVGFGRYQSLESPFANLKEIDDGFYLRVMGNDPPLGMNFEIGEWQKHAGVMGWNHPLPIRFYIEGDNLPSDVLIDQIELVGNNDKLTISSRAQSQSVFTQLPSDGFFLLSCNSQGQYTEPFQNIGGSPLAKAKKVMRKTLNGKVQLKTTIRSRTPHTIENLTLDWAADNGMRGSQSFETYLMPNHEKDFYIDLPENFQGRKHLMTIGIADIDGEPDAIKVNSSDTVFLYTPATTHFDRRVVMEEATGTWCGYCPRGIETIKEVTKEYPDNFIAIGLHTGDVMYPVNGSYDAIIGQFTSIPNCFINRTKQLEPDLGLVGEIVGSQKNTAEADVKVTALFTSSDSSIVTISTETVFGYSDNGTTEHRIAYVVLEDSVGPYTQVNYYSDPMAESFSDNYMDKWIHDDYLVEMFYNEVARGIFDSYQGVEGSVPLEIIEGDVYKYDYSFTLPDNVNNRQNIRIVALLIDCVTGEIMNAAQTKVLCNPSSIVELTSNHPTDVYTLTGIKMRTKVTTLVGLPKGMYIVNARRVVVK